MAPPENSEERNTIYALHLVKKNMPFLYHLLWYSEISSKKMKTVTILRVHRNLIFSPCSEHKAISLQLWEDGLLNRVPQSILNHNCFSGSKNKNTHFDNAAVTPLYDRYKPWQLMSCHEIMWKEPNKFINNNFVLEQFRMYFLKLNTPKYLLNTGLWEMWKYLNMLQFKMKIIIRRCHLPTHHKSWSSNLGVHWGLLLRKTKVFKSLFSLADA